MITLIWVGSIIGTMIIADQKKLNMVGYIFLSLFLGPIAVLIVLLVSPKNNKALGNNRVFTLQEAKQQLAQVKRIVLFQQQKVDELETKINQLVGEEVPVKEGAPQESVMEEKAQTKAVGVPSGEGFELVFGKYWLNRIGVVLFVIGIGLFISYTFQYLNAFARVLIGYMFSMAFFVWGNYLEKKKKYKKIAWGILGGAWGLLYLSTYAMHYIEATRIISSSIIEVLLLAIVSIAAIYYNLKYKSWIVTAITFLLAFITAGLGGMDYSSIIYFSLLAGSIAYLSYKLNWYPFLIFGIAGSYFTHLCWGNPGILSYPPYFQHGISNQIHQFHIIFGTFSINWAIFAFVLFLLKINNKEKLKYVVTGKLLNAGCFALLGLYEIDRVKSSWNISWDEKFWFLLLLSGMYFTFAYGFKRLNKSRLIVINSAIAFTLLAMAIFVKVPELSVGFYWILEMTILFILGVYYKEQLYRIFAGIMSIFIMLRLFFVDYFSHKLYMILNMELQHNILIFSFAAICFYMLGAIVKRKDIEKNLMKDELNFYYVAFPIAGTVLLTFLFAEEVVSKWLSLSWTLLGSAILSVGFFLRNKVFRLCALSVLTLVCLRVVLIDMSGVNTIYKISAFIMLGAVLLGISLIYSRFKIKNN